MQDHEFHLNPSKKYIAFLGMVIFVSLSIVLLLPLGHWLKLAGFILVSGYSGYIFWRYALLRDRHSIVSIRYLGDKKWLLHTRKYTVEADICSDSTLSGIVSVLRFKMAKRWWPVSCIVFRDSLDGDQYRKLLVKLKAE